MQDEKKFRGPGLLSKVVENGHSKDMKSYLTQASKRMEHHARNYRDYNERNAPSVTHENASEYAFSIAGVGLSKSPTSLNRASSNDANNWDSVSQHQSANGPVSYGMLQAMLDNDQERKKKVQQHAEMLKMQNLNA